jgi:hypothetical protein
MRIELKRLFSTEITPPEIPEDPTCCSVLIYADIGEAGKESADQFNFLIVTPLFLLAHPDVQWGKGYLLMPEFSWAEIENRVQQLVSSISADSWDEATNKLSKYLEWEFEDYQHA